MVKLYLFFLFITFSSSILFSDDNTCQLTVKSISKKTSWVNNHTGATIDSIFYVQLGGGDKKKVSAKDSARFTKLSLSKRYLIKIYKGNKRIQSFWLSFEKYQSTHLILTYKTKTGSWLINESLAKRVRREAMDSVSVGGRVIHVLVALCDNKTQGIVPVPELLGNGNEPKNNLYWGAMYGIKTYFKKSADWKLMKTIKNPHPNILERCVFSHANRKALLITDAYQGSKIMNTIQDFFLSLNGTKKTEMLIKGDLIKLHSKADLLVYVGHNGLMDFQLKKMSMGSPLKARNAIVLCCKSKQYFKPYLDSYGAAPVLLTTGFMAPEAYTLKAALDGWLLNEPNKKIKLRAAKAYHQYQKCGLRGAKRLFEVK